MCRAASSLWATVAVGGAQELSGHRPVLPPASASCCCHGQLCVFPASLPIQQQCCRGPGPVVLRVGLRWSPASSPGTRRTERQPWSRQAAVSLILSTAAPGFEEDSWTPHGHTLRPGTDRSRCTVAGLSSSTAAGGFHTWAPSQPLSEPRGPLLPQVWVATRPVHSPSESALSCP